MDAVYTHGHHESVLRSHRWRTAGNSAAYLLPHLKPHMKVLDVGSGPGTITADLAARVPDGHVTASEVTEDALELARAEVAARGLANVGFAVADVHALDYPDDTFCVAHAHQVLQHVGDPVRALREMGRVTKPGGLVAARDSDYSAFTWWPRVPALDEWMALYQRLARANGGEPDAGRRLLSWARAAGFEDVTATSSTGASPTRRTGPGGAGCGPTASCARPWPNRPWPPAPPRRRTCGACRTGGGNGRRPRTGGCPSCTARSSAA